MFPTTDDLREKHVKTQKLSQPIALFNFIPLQKEEYLRNIERFKSELT